MRNKSTRFSLFPGIILFLCLAITGLFLFHSPGRHRQDTLPTIPGQRLEISFITIGKGDAFILKMPDNSYYMYDTGKKEDWEQIEAVLDGKQISSLKGIFLSHGHKDHARNLKENPASVNKEIQARLDACHIEPFYSEGEWLAWDFSMDGTETIITKYGEE